MGQEGLPEQHIEEGPPVHLFPEPSETLDTQFTCNCGMQAWARRSITTTEKHKARSSRADASGAPGNRERRALQREQGLSDRNSTLRSGGPTTDSACQLSSAQGSTLSSITRFGRKRFIGSGSGIRVFRSASDDCDHAITVTTSNMKWYAQGQWIIEVCSNLDLRSKNFIPIEFQCLLLFSDVTLGRP